MSAGQFATALAALAVYSESSWQELRAINEEFLAECESEWRRLNPRKRLPTDRAKIHKGIPDYMERFDRVKAAKFDPMYEARDAETKRREAELKELAAAEPLPRVAELQECAVVYCSNYHTQGLGAIKYTRDDAQQQADKAVHYGLRVEVREHGEHRPARGVFGTASQDFAVYADTTPDGWEQLRRLPEVPLRDWLAACWKRGANPRVFNPFLPHGLEEKLGVDYFGNLYDVGAKTALTP